MTETMGSTLLTTTHMREKTNRFAWIHTQNMTDKHEIFQSLCQQYSYFSRCMQAHALVHILPLLPI